jgi:CRP-like cAMP-binding protein
MRTLVIQSFHYPPEEDIFRDGVRVSFLFPYTVTSGCLDLDRAFAANQRSTLATVGPSDLVSWAALSQARLETASARAVEETAKSIAI